jgi:hypothetical protein
VRRFRSAQYFEDVGELCSAANQNLIVAFDQVDDLPASLFEILNPLIHARAPYLSIMAARPFPYSPSTSLSNPIPGVNAEVHGVGVDRERVEWHDFLVELVSTRANDEYQLRVINAHLAQTIAISSSNPRLVLRVLTKIPARRGSSPDHEALRSDWLLAIKRVANQTTHEVETVLGQPAEYPKRFVASVAQLAIDIRAERGPGVVRVHFNDDGRALNDHARKLFRLSVREGLLLPVDIVSAIDWSEEQEADYELSGLVTQGTWEPEAKLAEFDSVPATASITRATLNTWASATRPRARRQRSVLKQVFVSHWFERPNLYLTLKDRLAGYAEVTTGDRTADGAIHEDVFDRIVRDADRFVLDLVAERPQCFVELGWAIGSHTPVILAVHDPALVGALHEWLRRREIFSYPTDESLRLLVEQVVASLNTPPSARSRWKATFERNLDPGIEPRRVAVVGGNGIDDAWAIVRDECRRVGLGVPQLLNLATTDVGAQLEEIIVIARSSAAIVTQFTGHSEIDLLLMVTLGVFSARKTFSRKRVLRQMVSIEPQGCGGAPSFLRFMDDRFFRHSTAASARGRIQSVLSTLERRTR